MALEFTEKPKRVEARRFDGSPDDMWAVLVWVQENGYTLYDTFTPAPSRGVSIIASAGYLSLVDSSGNLSSVQKGDWVIKQPNGDFKRMSNDEFEATFEPVQIIDDTNPTIEVPSN
jgi:hypothetical protein